MCGGGGGGDTVGEISNAASVGFGRHQGCARRSSALSVSVVGRLRPPCGQRDARVPRNRRSGVCECVRVGEGRGGGTCGRVGADWGLRAGVVCVWRGGGVGGRGYGEEGAGLRS